MHATENPRPLGVYLWLLLMLVLGGGGLYGGLTFLADPSGAGLGMTPQELPAFLVQDYTLPGLFLVVAMGVLPLAILAGLWARPDWAWAGRWNPWKAYHWVWSAGLGMGLLLVAWMIFEIAMIGFGSPLQVIFTAWGGLLTGVALLPGVRAYYRAA